MRNKEQVHCHSPQPSFVGVAPMGGCQSECLQSCFRWHRWSPHFPSKSLAFSDVWAFCICFDPGDMKQRPGNGQGKWHHEDQWVKHDTWVQTCCEVNSLAQPHGAKAQRSGDPKSNESTWIGNDVESQQLERVWRTQSPSMSAFCLGELTTPHTSWCSCSVGLGRVAPQRRLSWQIMDQSLAAGEAHCCPGWEPETEPTKRASRLLQLWQLPSEHSPRLQVALIVRTGVL